MSFFLFHLKCVTWSVEVQKQEEKEERKKTEVLLLMVLNADAAVWRKICFLAVAIVDRTQAGKHS